MQFNAVMKGLFSMYLLIITTAATLKKYSTYYYETLSFPNQITNKQTKNPDLCTNMICHCFVIRI